MNTYKRILILGKGFVGKKLHELLSAQREFDVTNLSRSMVDYHKEGVLSMLV